MSIEKCGEKANGQKIENEKIIEILRVITCVIVGKALDNRRHCTFHRKMPPFSKIPLG